VKGADVRQVIRGNQKVSAGDIVGDGVLTEHVNDGANAIVRQLKLCRIIFKILFL